MLSFESGFLFHPISVVGSSQDQNCWLCFEFGVRVERLLFCPSKRLVVEYRPSDVQFHEQHVSVEVGMTYCAACSKIQ